MFELYVQGWKFENQFYEYIGRKGNILLPIRSEKQQIK